MSLTTPPSVQKLQTALHDKAKGSPKFRFCALYDKVYRPDVHRQTKVSATDRLHLNHRVTPRLHTIGSDVRGNVR
jgi:hypothetical protein